MKKKAYAIMLILLLTISTVLSACTNSGGSNAGGESSGSSNSGDSGENYTLSAPGELPLVDKKTTIRITVPRSPNILSYEYGENDMTTWLEDQTNVHVEWNYYPSADAAQKLNLELSSGGDVGDLIMGFYKPGYMIDNAMIANYAFQGVFQPLDELIEKNGFYIKKMYEDHPEMKQATTAPDGKIYSMHEVGNCYNCNLAMRFWVHKDFLEALNMSVPTTTEELYQYLKAVKEQDVNGNGDPNDEIPMTGTTDGWFTEVHDFIMNAFTYKDGNDLYLQDDMVHASFATDGWREGLRYLNKLYSEGLIDPSAFTNDSAQMTQMVELNDGNSVAAAPGGVQPGTNDATSLKYTIVPPLKGPDGFQYTYFNEYGSIAEAKFILPANGKNKDLAMKWVDFMYNQDTSLRSRYGVPGVHWEVPEDGVVAANGGQAQFRVIANSIPEKQTHWWDGANQVYTPFSSDSRERFPEGQFDLETSLYDAAKIYEEYAQPGTMVPPFFFDPEVAPRYNELKNEIDKYVQASTADFIVGNLSIEDNWEAYLSELENIGLSEYLQIMQDEYDKNWK